MTNLRRVLALACLLASVACNAGDETSAPLTFVGPSNLVSVDLTVGTGATAAANDLVTVHYSMWLFNPTQPESKGQLLASSVGGAPFSIRIATGTVIQGWVEGVPGMKIGGRRRLTIPPSLAYGATGFQAVPPNAWLIFDIELINVTP